MSERSQSNYARRLEAVKAGLEITAVHLPLKPDAELPPYWAWVSDEDSFEEWGEAIAEGHRRHAIVLTSQPWELLDAIGYIKDNPLDTRPGEITAVFTNPLDWSVQTHSIVTL